MVKRIANFIGLLIISIYGLAYYLDIRKLPHRERMVVEFVLIALAVLLVIEIIRAVMELRAYLSKEGKSLSLKIKLDKQALTKVTCNKQVIVVVMTALYVFLFPIIGFFVTSFFYVFLLNLMLGIKNRMQLITVPAGLLVFVYVLFVLLFGVNLPTGIAI